MSLFLGAHLRKSLKTFTVSIKMFVTLVKPGNKIALCMALMKPWRRVWISSNHEPINFEYPVLSDFFTQWFVWTLVLTILQSY